MSGDLPSVLDDIAKALPELARDCCGRCEHFDTAARVQTLGADGLCRGSVPQVIATEYKIGRLLDGNPVFQATSFNAFFPIVKFGSLCGMFKRRADSKVMALPTPDKSN
jgi:hypothetical protein